jgi:hypothetical protein
MCGQHAAPLGAIGATANDYEHHGKVSIWIGTFASAEAMEAYVRTKYDEDGMCSPFSRDLGVLYYDHDLLEYSFNNRRRVRTALAAHSWSTTYLEAATSAAEAMIPGGANATVALFDFAFFPVWRPERPFARGRLKFVGAFDFRRPADSSKTRSTWRVPCPTCGHVPYRRRRRG